MAVEKRIVVGASGASGMPLLMKCLEILRDSEEYRSLLVMSRSAKLTLEQETDWSVSQVEALADEVLEQDNIGAGPAGGSSLKRKPEEYTVGMILRLTEGSLAPVDCVEDGADCGREDQCVTVMLWKKLNDAINSVVDNITLADLVEWQMQKSNEYVI